MEKIIDLHTHSTASDGSMSPRELVRHAKECGLSAIALTDHDTIDGIADALDEGQKLDITVIPGVEISAEFKPEMHILGYFSKDNYLNIKGTLDFLKEKREERNPRIINKLNELGIHITMEEVRDEAKGNIVGRPHISNVLIKKGYVKNFEEAFDKYLGNGKIAFFKKSRLTPEEGIKAIVNAGGVPVIAHPKYLNIRLNELDRLLADLKKVGLAGIEARYVENTEDETGNFLRLAIKYDLHITGGSDFHGTFKNGIEIGVGRGNLRVPIELAEKLMKSI